MLRPVCSLTDLGLQVKREDDVTFVCCTNSERRVVLGTGSFATVQALVIDQPCCSVTAAHIPKTTGSHVSTASYCCTTFILHADIQGKLARPAWTRGAENL